MYLPIKFQSSLSFIGKTGWMIKTFAVLCSGPALKYVLFWNGTLIVFAIGFCASCRAFSLSSDAAGTAASDGTGLRVPLSVVSEDDCATDGAVARVIDA